MAQRVFSKKRRGLGLALGLVLGLFGISRAFSAGSDPAMVDLGGSSTAVPAQPANPETKPSPTEQLSLRVNLPATRLDLYVNGKFDRSYNVAIGMPKYPTPIRDYSISHIVWNPWWIPPDSEWAQDAEKTPPGPGNPLGAVKLLMEDGIRIHGTNAPRSIGRASSHACLRMRSEDIKALAWKIQQAYSDKTDPELLEMYKKNPRSTFWVTLFAGVPVTVEYRQVETRGDKFLIHPDRYGRGGLQEELEAAFSGHPDLAVTKPLLAKLKKLRGKGTVEASPQELTQWSLGEEPQSSPESLPAKKS